jgi:hypothetical protein
VRKCEIIPGSFVFMVSRCKVCVIRRNNWRSLRIFSYMIWRQHEILQGIIRSCVKFWLLDNGVTTEVECFCVYPLQLHEFRLCTWSGSSRKIVLLPVMHLIFEVQLYVQMNQPTRCTNFSGLLLVV